MARIRSVHPEQWTDDKFVTTSPLARLVAIGVRNEADDNGIFEWNPVKLKMRLLPADNCDMPDLLNELEQSEQIFKFDIKGKAYGMVRNFQKYQKPKKPTFYHPIPTVQLPNGYELNPAYSETSSPPVPHQFGNSPSDGEEEGKEEGVTTSGEVIMSFPLDDGSEYPITRDKVNEYREAYPLVNVESALRAVRQWCRDNPSKRKSRRGATRFLNSWMGRAQADAEKNKTSEPWDERDAALI